MQLKLLSTAKIFSHPLDANSKEIAAQDLEAINNKTKSPQSIIRQQGDDPEETLREINEWHEKTKHLPSVDNSNEDPDEKPNDKSKSDKSDNDTD